VKYQCLIFIERVSANFGDELAQGELSHETIVNDTSIKRYNCMRKISYDPFLKDINGLYYFELIY
jgi:hypothetical protein